MYPIIIEGTKDKPKIVFDKTNGEFLIEGLSMCEDAISFYAPIFSWIKQYTLEPNPKTVLKFRLFYFNTASSKMILDIMLRFEEIYHMGNDVKIEWYYRSDDEDMEESGDIYAARLEVPVVKIEDDTIQ